MARSGRGDAESRRRDRASRSTVASKTAEKERLSPAIPNPIKRLFGPGVEIEDLTTEQVLEYIKDDITTYFSDASEVRSRLGPGSLERNTDASVKEQVVSETKCDNALATCKTPKVESTPPGEFGCTLTITGDHGKVTARVVDGKDMVVRYVKSFTGDDGKPVKIDGSALIGTPRVWSRLARWAATGEKKFTDRCKV